MRSGVNFEAKKYTLKGNWLHQNELHDFQYYYSFDELRFYRLFGMADFWNNNTQINFNQILTDVLSGISGETTELAYIIFSNKYRIDVYLGISPEMGELLSDAIMASFPFAKFEEQNYEDIDYLIKNTGAFGGLLMGNPTDKIKDDPQINQIEKLLKGLFGQKWLYIVTARGVNGQEASDLLEEVLTEMREISPKIKWSLDRQGVSQDERTEVTDYTAQSYSDEVKILSEKLQKACNNGLWRSMICYMAEDNTIAEKMGRLLKSIFSGEESLPQPIRNVPFVSIRKLTQRGPGLISDVMPSENQNFLGLKSQSIEPYSYYTYKYQNILSSDDLAVFCQIPKEETPGYFIDSYVKFDVSERRSNTDFYIGNVVYDGIVLPKNEYRINLKDLTRHGLITGITGGGKTNTAKHLLVSLYERHRKPFLVIESAKREYWELGRIPGLKDFMVFTLGNEGKDSVKYRLNPFERVGGTSLQTHIDYILSAFKASFELYAPMPYVLETCVYEIYADRGWDVLSDENLLKRTDDYPTLEDLYYKIEVVVDRLGYDNKLRSDIIAALQARISSLMIGGKGAMLNTQKSFPMEKLLGSPVVLELEDIGDDDVKSFIIGIILIQLYEYRKSKLTGAKGLNHILLIEEAHRLLKNVSTEQAGDTANPRGKAVEFFCNLLAEIRSYGQGILISDQMPTKLAPDVLKNTNLKITHRIVTQEDRNVIGNAMNMTGEQIDYISTFKTGFAAAYSEGDSRPKLIKIPYIGNEKGRSRKDILTAVNATVKSMAPKIYEKSGTGIGCNFCASKCKYKRRIEGLIEDGIISEGFIKGVVVYINKNRIFNGKTVASIIKRVEEAHLKRKLLADEKLCLLNYFTDRIDFLSDAYKREAIIRYLKQNS